MAKTPEKGAVELLAMNLSRAMSEFAGGAGISQNGLAKLSDVPQTTIGLLLNPHKREPRKSGKQPGPALAQLDPLAKALGIEVWELFWPLSGQALVAYKGMRKALKGMTEKEKA